MLNCIHRAAADNAWDKILTKIFPTDTERQLREMFSETECIERREFTVLHKIILGMLDKDLERELSGSTAEIDAVDSDNRTALALAAERGDVISVNLLLKYGADTAPASVCGNTALHCAVCAIDPCCIQPLIDHGAIVDAVTNWHQTPLIYVAAYRKDARHAQILIDAGANVDLQDLDGINPLGWTAITGNLPVAQALLQCGAQPLLKDNSNETGLTKCISLNRHDILEAIIIKLEGFELSYEESERVLLSVAQSADERTMKLLLRVSRAEVLGDVADSQGVSAAQLLRDRIDFSNELLRSYNLLHGVQMYANIDSDEEDDVWHDALE